MSPTVTNRAIALVFSVLVFVSGKQHVLLTVKVEKSEGRLLVLQNCTISKKPAVPVAAFLLNYKSLENIRSSNEFCFNSHGKCQPQECECGMNYFIHIMTLPLEKPQYIFSCEVRFNETFKGINSHVVYQDSIFYNSSGIYPLNETKEVKGQPSPKEKPQSPNEQDNSEHWILVSVPIILVLASPIIAICICRKKRCFKKGKRKRTLTQNKNDDGRACDAIRDAEIKNQASVRITDGTIEMTSMIDRITMEHISEGDSTELTTSKHFNDTKVSTKERTIQITKPEINHCQTKADVHPIETENPILGTNERTPMIDSNTKEQIYEDDSTELTTRTNEMTSMIDSITMEQISEDDSTELTTSDKDMNKRSENEEEEDKYFHPYKDVL